MTKINEEELREAIVCEESVSAWTIFLAQWGRDPLDVLKEAAQAYLEQKPCVDAIKAARREATEGEWASSGNGNVLSGKRHVCATNGYSNSDRFEEVISENNLNNQFITTAANEATKLLEMDQEKDKTR